MWINGTSELKRAGEVTQSFPDSVRPMKQCISAFNSFHHTLQSQLTLLSNIPVPSTLHRNFKRAFLCARYFQQSNLTATLKREHFYPHFTAVKVEAQRC